MEKLLTFDKYINQLSNKKQNSSATKYLNNEITFSELKEELSMLNESEVLDNIKSKLLDWSLSIFSSILNTTTFVVNKVFNLLNMVFNFVSRFKEKHPIIFKCIIIFLVIMVIVIVTSSSVYASETGDPVPTTKVINMSLGFLEKMDQVSNKYSTYDLMEAKAYLLKMRDGLGGDFKFSDTSIKLAKSALSTIQSTIDGYKTSHSESTIQALYSWFETGSKMILKKLSESDYGSSGHLTNIELGSK